MWCQSVLVVFCEKRGGRRGVCADQDLVLHQRILLKLKGLSSFYMSKDQKAFMKNIFGPLKILNQVLLLYKSSMLDRIWSNDHLIKSTKLLSNNGWIIVWVVPLSQFLYGTI